MSMERALQRMYMEVMHTKVHVVDDIRFLTARVARCSFIFIAILTIIIIILG